MEEISAFSEFMESDKCMNWGKFMNSACNLCPIQEVACSNNLPYKNFIIEFSESK